MSSKVNFWIETRTWCEFRFETLLRPWHKHFLKRTRWESWRLVIRLVRKTASFNLFLTRCFSTSFQRLLPRYRRHRASNSPFSLFSLLRLSTDLELLTPNVTVCGEKKNFPLLGINLALTLIFINPYKMSTFSEAPWNTRGLMSRFDLPADLGSYKTKISCQCVYWEDTQTSWWFVSLLLVSLSSSENIQFWKALFKQPVTLRTQQVQWVQFGT